MATESLMLTMSPTVLVHIIEGVLIPSWVSNSIASRVVKRASDLSTSSFSCGVCWSRWCCCRSGELTLSLYQLGVQAKFFRNCRFPRQRRRKGNFDRHPSLPRLYWHLRLD
jgi:hypothetical protein